MWTLNCALDCIGHSENIVRVLSRLEHDQRNGSEFLRKRPCEGSRGLSTRLNERKVCSMLGFPRIVTGFTRDAEGQWWAAASGAPLLKYRWE
eukprot:COSAG02_NODE_26630_length_628_cov_15.931947_1_plen_91_part_10